MLLTAPKYFNLTETEKGTVLVKSGALVREDIGERYGNRQFYFQDEENEELVCLSGGSLAYLIDTYNLNKTKKVRITYDGTKELETGKFKGKASHQFKVELLEDTEASNVVEDAASSEAVEADPDSLD